MKAASLAFLRVSTGLLLIIWGLIKVAAPDAAIHVSDTYYAGMLSMQSLQTPLGVAEAVLGLLVVLGLFRPIVLPLQALVLVVGAAAIWRYLLDPLGLYLLTEETRQVLFFPSLGIAAASLVSWAFCDEDRFVLDRLLFRKPV
jgi:putative oxidoreductase